MNSHLQSSGSRRETDKTGKASVDVLVQSNEFAITEEDNSTRALSRPVHEGHVGHAAQHGSPRPSVGIDEDSVFGNCRER